MKTSKKCLAIISSAVILAAANPAFSQDDTAPSRSSAAQSSEAVDPISAPRLDTNQQTSPQMQPSERDAGTVMAEPAGATTDTNNWSWIGLLGLAGLFGLKRHREEKTGEYRTSRA